MNLVRSFAIALVAIGLAATAPPANADPYDTPVVSVLEASRTSVLVQVRAGATGAPGGFAMDWMYKSDFDAAGGWLGGYSAGTVYWCGFTGQASWNHVETSTNYALGPFEAQVVEVGDIFDETGMDADYWSELDPGREIVMRVYALGDGGGEDSYYTSTVMTETNGHGHHGHNDDCIHSQGYWKTHASAWPVSTLMLGTVSYTKTQLLQILNKQAKGNGLIILAHQLIASKLNLANGAVPGPIAAHVASADAMIGGSVIPPVGSGYLSPTSVQYVSNKLDRFNNGCDGHDQCGVTPTRSATWGGVKALYR